MSHFSQVNYIWHNCLFSSTDQYMIHSVSFLPPKFHHLLPVCFVIRLLPEAEQLQYFSCNEVLRNSKGKIYHIWPEKLKVCTKYLSVYLRDTGCMHEVRVKVFEAEQVEQLLNPEVCVWGEWHPLLWQSWEQKLSIEHNSKQIMTVHFMGEY